MAHGRGCGSRGTLLECRRRRRLCADASQPGDMCGQANLFSFDGASDDPPSISPTHACRAGLWLGHRQFPVRSERRFAQRGVRSHRIHRDFPMDTSRDTDVPGNPEQSAAPQRQGRRDSLTRGYRQHSGERRHGSPSPMISDCGLRIVPYPNPIIRNRQSAIVAVGLSPYYDVGP